MISLLSSTSSSSSLSQAGTNNLSRTSLPSSAVEGERREEEGIEFVPSNLPPSSSAERRRRPGKKEEGGSALEGRRGGREALTSFQRGERKEEAEAALIRRKREMEGNSTMM